MELASDQRNTALTAFMTRDRDSKLGGIASYSSTRIADPDVVCAPLSYATPRPSIMTQLPQYQSTLPHD